MTTRLGNNLNWCLDNTSFIAMLQDCLNAEVVSLDTETTGLDPWAMDAEVVMVQVTTEDNTWLVPVYHPDSPWKGIRSKVLKNLCEFLVTCQVKLVGANIKFDAKWLSVHSGVDISQQCHWDVTVAGHLLNENEKHGLEEMAVKYLGVKPWAKQEIHKLMSKPGGALNVPMVELGIYGAQDTIQTLALYRWQMSQMFLTGEEEPLYDDDWLMYGLGRLAQEVSMPTVRALARLELQGMKVDRETVKETMDSALKAGRDNLSAMSALYPHIPGEPSVHATSKWFKAWASRCVDDGLLRESSYTSTGAVQWNAAALKRNERAGSAAAPLVLKARDGLKQAEFLKTWYDLSERDGKIHSTYNVGTVSTGRLSSSEPNLQQVKRSLKPVFIPHEGYYLGEFDYSQLEVRIAAHIANSESLAEAYARGLDIHREMASATSGKPYDEVTSEERTRAKCIIFGFLYGMSAEGFKEFAENSYGTLFSLEEAYHIREVFFKRWPELPVWHAKTLEYARSNLQVISPLGRIRRVPDIHSRNSLYRSHAQAQAINAPVQGMGSDIMCMSIARIQQELPHVRPVATVHDSVELLLPQHSWEQDAKLVKEIMETPDLSRFRVNLKVPLLADEAIGHRWADDCLSARKECRYGNN